jgi:O-antigen ligase
MLGLAVALLALFAWRDRRFLWAIPLGLALVGVVVYSVGPREVATALLSVDHPLGVAVVLRLDMWLRALAMLRDMPYTGIGLDTFPLIQSQFYPGVLLGRDPHAHNLYLQLALDLGLPGLFAFCWLIVESARAVWRASPRRSLGPGTQATLMGAVAGVLAYLSTGLLDSPWAMKPGILLWVLLGLVLALSRLGDGERSLPPLWRRLLPLAALTAVVLLSLLILPAIGARNLGSIEAHRALLEAQETSTPDTDHLRQAVNLLRWASQRFPDNAHTYRTLGRLYGWLDRPRRAVEVLEDGVALDVQDPFNQYAPWLAWLRALQEEGEGDPTADLLWVYSQWMGRYPERAEHYVQAAQAWDRYAGDPTQARNVVERGISQGAKPLQLLEHFQSEVD